MDSLYSALPPCLAVLQEVLRRAIGAVGAGSPFRVPFGVESVWIKRRRDLERIAEALVRWSRGREKLGVIEGR
jgi:hypothetical protein